MEKLAALAHWRGEALGLVRSAHVEGDQRRAWQRRALMHMLRRCLVLDAPGTRTGKAKRTLRSRRWRDPAPRQWPSGVAQPCGNSKQRASRFMVTLHFPSNLRLFCFAALPGARQAAYVWVQHAPNELSRQAGYCFRSFACDTENSIPNFPRSFRNLSHCTSSAVACAVPRQAWQHEWTSQRVAQCTTPSCFAAVMEAENGESCR